MKIDKKKIKIKEEWKQENGLYKCPHCNKEYKKFGICSHIWKAHTEEGQQIKRIAWNKGLTKETSESLKKQGETYSNKIKSGEIIPSQKNKPIDLKTKQKISESMKKAHAEGRAWNIGMSRWNNKPSYPEEFFMKVIENEFNNKDYVREYNLGIYSIDFAWVDKKLAIEIDGEQHERFEEYKQRDIRKDNYLQENDWKVLRIKWSDMCNNPKEWIQIANNFIN